MNKLKLLYAEDERRIRKDHIIYLRSRYDFIFYEANDGEEALKIFKEHKPDILLTDISMPNMCGLELAREVRKISHHTKIIILTAHSEQDKLMQAFDSDVVNYLIKPINRYKLKNSIDIAMQTLPAMTDNISNKKHIYLNDTSKFDMITNDYTDNEKTIKLSHSETKLLALLCERKNTNISSYDIFVNVWEDFEKDFSSDSVRTLVKKLRKKLPQDILKNIYGGFYKLVIK